LDKIVCYNTHRAKYYCEPQGIEIAETKVRAAVTTIVAAVVSTVVGLNDNKGGWWCNVGRVA